MTKYICGILIFICLVIGLISYVVMIAFKQHMKVVKPLSLLIVACATVIMISFLVGLISTMV